MWWDLSSFGMVADLPLRYCDQNIMLVERREVPNRHSAEICNYKNVLSDLRKHTSAAQYSSSLFLAAFNSFVAQIASRNHAIIPGCE